MANKLKLIEKNEINHLLIKLNIVALLNSDQNFLWSVYYLHKNQLPRYQRLGMKPLVKNGPRIIRTR
ncbi:hypothetical protein GE061_016359 [Apolygus lucorum]|uniref:Uncharacterized protein n=1 Tax=Apolygus lucorum TaxID=248454 RepID=A0A8S9XFS6_APOLU|nr:hypothetical protein GE061_016359 [Apolygus lucorum]